MNPFDLRGPEFLLFYLALGAVTVMVMVLRRFIMEPQPPMDAALTDPYLIAYLRGGPNEVLRVATVTLVERKLLSAIGTRLATTVEGLKAAVRPIETLLLAHYRAGGEAKEMFGDAALRKGCDEFRAALERMGLVPDAVQKVARWMSALVALALLAGVAVIKVDTALGRGKSNVGFLVLLGIGFAIATLALASPRRTPRGNAALKDLQELYRDARLRTTSASSAAEIALVAGIFGMTALPFAAQNAYAKSLFPQAQSGSLGGCGSSCGSSCGGGGCGGGCGGCGS